MDPELIRFQDQHSLITALADAIQARLSAAIAARGAASLIVSGGSTPKALFAVLAHRELPWERISISLADERWVSPDSTDSNEHLVRNYLLQHHAAVATFVPLKTAHATPEQAELECAARLEKLPSPFDVVLLGMGDDGHTASLFPGAAELDRALNVENNIPCLALTPKILPQHAPYARMTLSLSRLLKSHWLALLFVGESKLNVYNRALADSDWRTMPVRAILQSAPVSVYCAP